MQAKSNSNDSVFSSETIIANGENLGNTGNILFNYGRVHSILGFLAPVFGGVHKEREEVKDQSRGHRVRVESRKKKIKK